jgi:hypothetical protein
LIPILLGSVNFRSTEANVSSKLAGGDWTAELLKRLAVGIDTNSVGFRELQINGMEPASRPNWPSAIVYIPLPQLSHLKVNQDFEILQTQLHLLRRNTSEPQYTVLSRCFSKLAVGDYIHSTTSTLSSESQPRLRNITNAITPSTKKYIRTTVHSTIEVFHA